MRPGDLGHALTHPGRCATWLSEEADLWGVRADLLHADSLLVVLDVMLAGPPALPSYPDEHVRISIRADGAVFAVPVDPAGRRWEHRYPRLAIEDFGRPEFAGVDWHFLFGALCLWYPDDPENLRWSWVDGLDAYIRVVQRHLWSEEYHRRWGQWPGEAAPHGRRPDRQPPPILLPALRVAA